MKRGTLNLGLTLIGIVVVLAAVGLVWTPFDPTKITGSPLQPPGWPHVLGTDGLGADVLSRLMSGAKICLLVGIVSVAGAAVVGVPIGIFSGMTRGWISDLPARLSDILYGFPALLLAILLAAAVGGSTWTAMIAISVATIPAFVRLARAATYQVMSHGYIEAARVSGIPKVAIAVRHVLPNIAPVLGVQASVSFGIAILAEAGLSYLGLGSGPEAPTWGRMLREAQDYLFNAPILALWPGLAIAVATMGFNLLGDGLRDLFDPRLREMS
ncbi:peptide/nickel transport system permease protein [Tessaracoccus bendigoensis DSM 12906]|uniref:Peptide/nickel transport system permease protein n=1 Tax=Tessaracoccus bendigoensis DSM 12906 TaxID=1123357 RepID=A0A1M6GDH9_9ACTN|nr:ABC transporter permease [Tessaracoccus bendigoensis]SHJ07994.1 peptide/nickel transport system permease protein [Tessaracoccus bendigoensis DSM 12906]